MATFSNNLGAFSGKNEQSKYHCKLCDYVCSKKYNWERHLTTSKHIKSTNCNTPSTLSEQKEQNEQSKYICDNCGKHYTERTGLWRHKKKCNNSENKISIQTQDEQQQLIQYLMKENSEFKQLMIEQNKTMLELAKNSGTTNNSHNNTNSHNAFNLNFYLNETCKNAMNITDFVSQLQIKNKDLEETGRLGYAEGISRIFINGLKQMSVTDRPIHCSDVKRETLYIKDNNEWNKDNEDKSILTNAIKQVTNKNIKQIFEWTKENPEYNDPTTKVNDKYLKIVSNSMNGLTKEETNKNYEKIIKNIAKETVIDK